MVKKVAKRTRLQGGDWTVEISAAILAHTNSENSRKGDKTGIAK